MYILVKSDINYKVLGIRARGTMSLDTSLGSAGKSPMCDVINIRLKRRTDMRSGKGNQQLNIKSAVERSILKHMTLSSAS